MPAQIATAKGNTMTVFQHALWMLVILALSLGIAGVILYADVAAGVWR